MDGTFEITIDSDRDLVRTRLCGFFDDALFARYVAARRSAFDRLLCGPNQHLSLTDVREMKIQSQDIVDRFGVLLADPAFRSKRLAFVVASTLARMQLRRALGDRVGDGVDLFLDPDAAEGWVLAAARQRAA